MFEDMQIVAHLVFQGFLHLLPYMLITIPLAVAVQLSGAAKYIRKAFSARPIPSIILATIVGAFSPFCSCGVIPVIASLLIGGVPLAPVMSFWIASPSMDPEIFFLSVATIGWDLALWRLLSTLVLSLGAGFMTHVAVQRGWISGPILRSQTAKPGRSLLATAKTAFHRLRTAVWPAAPVLATETCCASTMPLSPVKREGFINNRALSTPSQPTSPHFSPAFVARAARRLVQWDFRPEGRGVVLDSPSSIPMRENAAGHGASPAVAGSWRDMRANEGSYSPACEASDGSSSSPDACSVGEQSFMRRLLREGGSAALMVGKFMMLALVLEALFTLYVPREWVVALVGQSNRLAILTAALVGVPLYTSNLTALPMVGALLAQGMNPSSALAFLIAGPITTIPAMAAVWGLVHRRVFALYVAFALVGAILMGIAHHIVAAF